LGSASPRSGRGGATSYSRSKGRPYLFLETKKSDRGLIGMIAAEIGMSREDFEKLLN
jgi:hypothetical protein